MTGSGDVQMADAAGAAGSRANGAESPAGRAGSVASGDSGSPRDGSSSDNGLNVRNGGVHAGYPGEAEDQAAEPPPVEGAGPSPFRRPYFSPPSLGSRDGVPSMSDDALMDAATNNRRVASTRIEQGHWGTPPGLSTPSTMCRTTTSTPWWRTCLRTPTSAIKASRDKRTRSWSMTASWSDTNGRSTTSMRVFTRGRFCSPSTRGGHSRSPTATSGSASGWANGHLSVSPSGQGVVGSFCARDGQRGVPGGAHRGVSKGG